MGYRSDVRIITSKKGYDALRKYVDKQLPKEEKEYNLLENASNRFVNSKAVLIGWDSIKWYEQSDDICVDSIMNGLNHLSENGYSYRYARIGESTDDYDEFCSDGEKDKDLDFLPYPCFCRYFDDEYTKNEMDILSPKNNKKSKEVEI